MQQTISNSSKRAHYVGLHRVAASASFRDTIPDGCQPGSIMAHLLMFVFLISTSEESQCCFMAMALKLSLDKLDSLGPQFAAAVAPSAPDGGKHVDFAYSFQVSPAVCMRCERRPIKAGALGDLRWESPELVEAGGIMVDHCGRWPPQLEPPSRLRTLSANIAWGSSSSEECNVCGLGFACMDAVGGDGIADAEPARCRKSSVRWRQTMPAGSQPSGISAVRPMEAHRIMTFKSRYSELSAHRLFIC